MANLPTAQQVAAKWKSRMGSAGPDYQAGIERVTQSPMDKAASDEAQNKYRINTAEASSSGRMARRLRETTLENWKASIRAKGVSRFQQAGTADMEKFQRGIAPVLQQEAAIIDQIRAMPSTTYEERQARQRAWSDAMHQWKMSRTS